MEPPDIDHLYYKGGHYDQRYKVMTEDIPFWIRRAEEFGDPILELASGTGRVAIPLAKQGFSVTGVDLSESMRAEAIRKSKEEGVEAEWVKGDIRNFHLRKGFNLTIFPLNTICHFLDLKDLESCLSCVREHMLPDGKFITDAFVPDPHRLTRSPNDRFLSSEYEDPEGKGKVVVYESNEYDSASQINRVKLYYQLPGQKEEVVEELNMRMFFPQELDALLRYNGFKIDRKFGDYEDTPFNSRSPKQLLICSVEK